MRTDDLIAALAADSQAVKRGGPQRSLLLAAAIGAAVALALVLLWLGVRADLRQALGGLFFWIKALYTAVLALTLAFAAERLVRPGQMPRAALALSAGVVGLFVIAGLAQLLSAEPDSWLAMLRGQSWKLCTRNILILGSPMTLAAVLLLRPFAPTSPTLAGLVAGLFSGATAATVYGLHCGEATFAFVGLWYTLGVVCCGLLGALLGRWLLRW